jgi:hypothetical protein
VAQDFSSFLEYAKYLREEEHAHREYLETLYTRTTAVLGLIVAIVIALVSFFQFKTRKDVRKTVDAAFRDTVEEEVQNRTEQFKTNLDKIAKGQLSQKLDIEAIRVALRGIVSKWEIDYLRRLAKAEPWNCRWDLDTFSRLKRLDEIGFVLPVEKHGKRSFEEFRRRFQTDEPLDKREWFDMKDYWELTEDGKGYLESCERLGI